MKLSFDSIQVKIIPDQPIALDNIYYEFDKYDLTAESKAYLDSTLIVFIQKYPNLVIEILSHTDNKGTDEYNINLSQKRSDSVIGYLEEKGIGKDRLLAKGMGVQFPIAKNTNEDGSDNPEGRQKNRRTEFILTRQ
jgi:outer membrane protein OmpA-like peptidoglycan-associated protein